MNVKTTFYYFIGFIFLSLSFNLKAQEKVTTFGIQFKPIVPLNYIDGGKQAKEQNNISFEIDPKVGLSFGMVIRKGLTKNISLETGINYLRRNFSLSINDKDSAFSSNSKFRLVTYEIPVSGLVYVQLGREMFMNVSGGLSVDVYPTPLFVSEYEVFANAVNRKSWVQLSLIANVGWEYRTRKSGYWYVGFSFHRPFSSLMQSFVTYEAYNRNEEARFDLSGNYLTIDLRYFFHEDKEKKAPPKKDFRQKKPEHLK